MSTTFTVRVAGPILTTKVTWEQVRAYLTKHGFTRQGTNDDVEMWRRIVDEIWQTVWVGRFHAQEEHATVERAIRSIAFHLHSHESQVLREVAGLPDDAAITAAWQRWCAARARLHNATVAGCRTLAEHEQATQEAWEALCQIDPKAERAGRGEDP